MRKLVIDMNEVFQLNLGWGGEHLIDQFKAHGYIPKDQESLDFMMRLDELRAYLAFMRIHHLITEAQKRSIMDRINKKLGECVKYKGTK